MIKIFHSNTLINSPVYDYFKQGSLEKSNYYVSIGHSQSLSDALQDFEESISGIVWGELSGQYVGFICYSLKDVDKKVILINLAMAENKEVSKEIYVYFENLALELGCVYINETVTIKDETRIKKLEEVGFKKEFCLMYKKV